MSSSLEPSLCAPLLSSPEAARPRRCRRRQEHQSRSSQRAKIHRRDRECARGDAEEVHLGTVEIDDLTVRRLHVIEEKPSASRESDAG
jgi:hypothetical protein